MVQAIFLLASLAIGTCTLLGASSAQTFRVVMLVSGSFPCVYNRFQKNCVVRYLRGEKRVTEEGIENNNLKVSKPRLRVRLPRPRPAPLMCTVSESGLDGIRCAHDNRVFLIQKASGVSTFGLPDSPRIYYILCGVKRGGGATTIC